MRNPSRPLDLGDFDCGSFDAGSQSTKPFAMYDLYGLLDQVVSCRGNGSRAMTEDRDCPLKTKRLVVGQITICRGCCCGNVERGLPEVPVEWLKSEWRKRGLLKRVQLTISGCVGPCDVPNVVVITSSSGTEWLGNIVKFDQYRSLVEWAVRCRDAGEMLILPREFLECRISPFCS